MVLVVRTGNLGEFGWVIDCLNQLEMAWGYIIVLSVY